MQIRLFPITVTCSRYIAVAYKTLLNTIHKKRNKLCTSYAPPTSAVQVSYGASSWVIWGKGNAGYRSRVHFKSIASHLYIADWVTQSAGPSIDIVLIVGYMDPCLSRGRLTTTCTILVSGNGEKKLLSKKINEIIRPLSDIITEKLYWNCIIPGHELLITVVRHMLRSPRMICLFY